MSKKLKENQPEEQEISHFQEPEKYWGTYDLGCSAALVSVGYELVSLDKTNPRKAQFIFLRKEKIEETVNDYFSNKLKVNARTLFDNIRMLKNRIYSS